MLKKIKKYWILTLIAGVILLAFGITMLIRKNTEIVITSKWTINLAEIAVGIVFSIIIYFFAHDVIAKTSNNRLKTMFIIEAVLLSIIAVLGFLVPGFTNYNIFQKMEMFFWIGLAIYIHGILEALTSKIVNTKHSLIKLIIALILITVGTILFINPPAVGDTVNLIIQIAFVVAGTVSLVLGIIGCVNFINRKKTKPVAIE